VDRAGAAVFLLIAYSPSNLDGLVKSIKRGHCQSASAGLAMTGQRTFYEIINLGLQKNTLEGRKNGLD
jgi:ABC-type arginine transport system permease subunit